MKALKIMLAAVAFAAIACLPAAAQFRIGPRIGTEVNSMRLNSSLFDNDNRAGFTGGVQVEFTVPVINLGFDASVMYVHRVSNSAQKTATSLPADDQNALNSSSLRKRDYIEIPVNFKYKLGLPVVGKIISPYFFTGPSFAFLASKRAINATYKNKSFDYAWNFGVDVELIQHLQIGASYGVGLGKSVKYIGLDPNANPIEGKNNYWTVTAAWLF